MFKCAKHFSVDCNRCPVSQSDSIWDGVRGVGNKERTLGVANIIASQIKLSVALNSFEIRMINTSHYVANALLSLPRHLTQLRHSMSGAPFQLLPHIWQFNTFINMAVDTQWWCSPVSISNKIVRCPTRFEIIIPVKIHVDSERVDTLTFLYPFYIHAAKLL